MSDGHHEHWQPLEKVISQAELRHAVHLFEKKMQAGPPETYHPRNIELLKRMVEDPDLLRLAQKKIDEMQS